MGEQSTTQLIDGQIDIDNQQAKKSNVALDRILGIVAVLIAAILWGTTGTAAAMAPDVSSIAIAAVAMGGGGLLQALLAHRSIKTDFRAICQHQRFVWIGAMAVAIYPLAFYGSMRLAGVAIGTVVSIGSAPILSALLERVFENRRLDKKWLLGTLFGLLGILLLSFAKPHHLEQSHHETLGIVFGLVAGLTYALYSWTARQLMQKQISTKAAMGVTFGVGALVLLPVLFVSGASLLESMNNFLVGLYMATVPMFIGYLCFGYGLARVSASTAITITLVEPVVATLLAVWVLSERLSVVGWMGMALILCCLMITVLPTKPNS